MTLNLIIAFIGVALMVGLSGVGSVYGLTICGNTVVGSLKKRPEALGTYILLSALPSTSPMEARKVLVRKFSAVSVSGIT